VLLASIGLHEDDVIDAELEKHRVPQIMQQSAVGISLNPTWTRMEKRKFLLDTHKALLSTLQLLKDPKLNPSMLLGTDDDDPMLDSKLAQSVMSLDSDAVDLADYDNFDAEERENLKNRMDKLLGTDDVEQ